MENNVICKAEIKSKCLVLIIVYTLVVALSVFIGFDTRDNTVYETNNEATFFNYQKGNYDEVYDYDKPPRYKEKIYRLYGIEIAKNTYDVGNNEGSLEGLSCESWAMIAACIIVLLPLMIILIIKNKAKKSKLELTDEGITAVHKKMLSTENIKLTIEKVENATIKKNLYNILTGGKTVVICTGSGNYKFPWVQNADEFVDAALEKMKS